MDDALFTRYSNFFKGREANGGSNRLSLPKKKDAEAQIYHFLISEKMGKALVKNIAKSNKTTSVATKFSMNFKSVEKPMNSENVAAIIKGSENQMNTLLFLHI